MNASAWLLAGVFGAGVAVLSITQLETYRLDFERQVFRRLSWP